MHVSSNAANNSVDHSSNWRVMLALTANRCQSLLISASCDSMSKPHRDPGSDELALDELEETTGSLSAPMAPLHPCGRLLDPKHVQQQLNRDSALRRRLWLDCPIGGFGYLRPSWLGTLRLHVLLGLTPASKKPRRSLRNQKPEPCTMLAGSAFWVPALALWASPAKHAKHELASCEALRVFTNKVRKKCSTTKLPDSAFSTACTHEEHEKISCAARLPRTSEP